MCSTLFDMMFDMMASLIPRPSAVPRQYTLHSIRLVFFMNTGFYYISVHVFFDDAMEPRQGEEQGQGINSFVKQMLDVISKACR